jgi:hypothetical protein
MNEAFNPQMASAGGKVNYYNFIYLAFCCLYIYLHLFILPNLPIFYEEDHLIFVHDAWRMLEGEAIYRDFFQITFPGTQVFYLLLFYIFGTKFWLVNATVFLQAIVQTVLCLAVSKRIIGNNWYAYLPPSLFLFLGFRWFGIDGSHRMLSPIFVWAAIYILLKKRTYWRLFLAGLFCAFASFFTQQRGLLAVGAIAVFLFVAFLKDRTDWRRLLTSEFVLLFSYAVVIFALITPFLVSAGPKIFFDYTIFYISKYVQDPSANYQTYFIAFQKIFDQGILVSVIMFFYYAMIPLIYLVVFIFLWLKRKSLEESCKDRVLLISIVGFCLSIGTFAPNAYRLFQISIPALVVFGWLLFQLKPKSNWFIKPAVVGLMLFGGVLAIRIQTAWENHLLKTPTGTIVFQSPVVLERYKWLSENAVMGEYVFEVYQCAVSFSLQLRNPTNVPFLANTGFTSPRMVAEAVESLEQKKTRLIIWDAAWDKELETPDHGENLGAFSDYLKRNYVLVKSFTPYNYRQMQVWERKN